ncbi:hypothetical protein MASSI9I_20579 [Massilia sp. 9I]|nr:hypothetical protein MASSI9I_20579 [Massilia sp. 9I]
MHAPPSYAFFPIKAHVLRIDFLLTFESEISYAKLLFFVQFSHLCN